MDITEKLDKYLAEAGTMWGSGMFKTMDRLAQWMIAHQTKLPGPHWGKAIDFVAKKENLTKKEKKKLEKLIDKYTER